MSPTRTNEEKRQARIEKLTEELARLAPLRPRPATAPYRGHSIRDELTLLREIEARHKRTG